MHYLTFELIGMKIYPSFDGIKNWYDLMEDENNNVTYCNIKYFLIIKVHYH